jgi:hypothetical protein
LTRIEAQLSAKKLDKRGIYTVIVDKTEYSPYAFLFGATKGKSAENKNDGGLKVSGFIEGFWLFGGFFWGNHSPYSIL